MLKQLQYSASLTFLSIASLISIHQSTIAQDSAPTALAKSLELAGDNRSEIEGALQGLTDEQKEGMQFLIENMPLRDLTSLKASFLQEHVRLAYEAFNKAPWKEQVPKDIFLNNVLPYAVINERRDAWREDFINRFSPLVAEAKTSGQAGVILNQKIFGMLKVKYSTGRRKADQCPAESIETGLASCSGLSVLLIDACRAVGVPARFAGTPLWSDNSGNHSWVEIWDNGQWHFTGAAEPAGDALDQAWFIGRAGGAKRDSRQNAIYATSFQRTPTTFPLVWDFSIDYVYAVNVTDRYLQAASPVPDGFARVNILAVDAASGRRVCAPVKVIDETGKVALDSSTNDERFDANDHVNTVLPLKKKAKVEVEFEGKKVSSEFDVEKMDQLIRLEIKKDAP